MERTKVDKQIQWIKKGGGTFRLRGGKIIKQNQRFFAPVSDIPEAFRDTIVPLNSAEFANATEAQEEEAPELDYFPVLVGGGWYNVEDSNGKVVNEAKLRSAAAAELIENLKK